MNYEKLVKANAIEQIHVSHGDISDHIRKARHDIQVAQNVSSIDLDWAFTIAYNGILQAATAFMNYEGYRPKGEAKHYNTFRFLKVALSASYGDQIDRLQNLRKKRNRAVYLESSIVSESEAYDIIDFSKKFLDEISNLLPDEIIKMSKEP